LWFKHNSGQKSLLVNGENVISCQYRIDYSYKTEKPGHIRAILN
jgi:hypothetical protein